MKRKEFLKLSLAVGLGSPLAFQSLFASSRDHGRFHGIEGGFDGKIVIVGAGAAGMSAGYLLSRQGVNFEIFEAANRYGGRIKHTTDFVDFPLDLGAEWIHADPSILDELCDHPNLKNAIETIVYDPVTYQLWKNGELRDRDFIKHLYSEYKFKDSSWFSFFDQMVVPQIADKIHLNSPVTSIDYRLDKVALTFCNGEQVEADKVLITVPIKILQSGDITFYPDLPDSRRKAIHSISMGDGLKVFLEFSKRFYPDILAFDSMAKAILTDNRTYYNAAFKKDSERNVLGLFCINQPASNYIAKGSDSAVIDYIISELDQIFTGQASAYYLRHHLQNWTAEPYIRGSYSYDFDLGHHRTVKELTQPVNEKLYFAGEALSFDYQATVHGAALSGHAAVAQLLAK